VSIGRKAIVGALWTSGANYVSQGVGFLSQAALGRLLLEAEYGLFATANSMVQFIFILSAFSFNLSIIQCQEERERLYSTAFVLSLALCIVSLLLSGLAIAGYAMFKTLSTVEIAVIVALSVSNMTNLLGQHFDAILQRNLEFKRISIISFVMNLANPLVALTCALSGLGIWSLVLGQFVASLVFLIGSYASAHWRISLAFSGTTARWLGSLGWKFLWSRMLEVVYTELDRIVIKRMNSYDQVGIYDRANLAARYPARIVTPSIINVALPVYSRVKDEGEKLPNAYELVNFWLVRVLMPFGLIFFLCAPAFMTGVFGQRWLASAGVLQVLALYAVLHPMVENLRVLFYSLGRPDDVAKVRVLQIAVYIPALILLVMHHGIIGAAYAILISIVVTYAAFLFRARRLLHASMLRVIVAPFVFAALTIGVYQLLPRVRAASNVLALAAESAIVLAVYLAWELLVERRELLRRLAHLRSSLKESTTTE
jgi:O-antigen/teichoic acid export membrane protein